MNIPIHTYLHYNYKMTESDKISIQYNYRGEKAGYIKRYDDNYFFIGCSQFRFPQKMQLFYNEVGKKFGEQIVWK